MLNGKRGKCKKGDGKRRNKRREGWVKEEEKRGRLGKVGIE